ncbi:hypothetical protein F4813DRAFT_354147 [Daldinia decipiens]|uniref:uncharacterized protein n=1 Tax=Daldinia decipiens TaxID=326647 RepID=UPI0020C3EE9F|nr:uncharacterized protein F4813DRAFT_354147 [Daldinia decipiens]KAI1659199.1 hypothetical protein F4813DRAFT_354147 [Daldinia decipiens]
MTYQGDLEPYILDVCSSGDISTLQRLFTDHGIQPGSKPVYPKLIDPGSLQEALTTTMGLRIPPTSKLLEQAVAAEQVAIVKFILQMYPSFSLMQEHGIVRAVLEHPNPEILQVLCNHERNFASFSIDSGMRSFLTDACARPPEEIGPVLHVLLDYGADVYDGWGPGGGALYAAVIGGQSLEIVERILERTSAVSRRNVSEAIRRGRVDVVELFLNRGRLGPGVRPEEIVEEAEKWADREIIAVVRSWTRRAKGKERKGLLVGYWGKVRNIANII